VGGKIIRSKCKRRAMNVCQLPKSTLSLFENSSVLSLFENSRLMTKIFAKYHKRLCYYVNQARDAQRLSLDSSDEVIKRFGDGEKEAVYSTVNDSKSADDM
jgi:hypothetical protein